MSTPTYILERHPHGWLLRQPPNQLGIPIDAFTEATGMLPKKRTIHPGVASANGALAAFGTPASLKKWAEEITAELAAKQLPKEDQWEHGPDTGWSSKALFSRLVYPMRPRTIHHPHDADDFGRCVRMVAFLGLRARLTEARDLSPAWASIISRWDALCELHATGKLGIIEFP